MRQLTRPATALLAMAALGLSAGRAHSSCATIAGGQDHVVVSTFDGAAWAAGGNGHGQLGEGTKTIFLAPVQVKDETGLAYLSDVSQVATNGDHSLAVRSDGTAWAWGANDTGQLGDGTLLESTLPVQVRDASGAGFLTDVVKVATGTSGQAFEAHSMALLADGTVWTWGSNVRGELGDGTLLQSSLPVQVQGPPGTGPLYGITNVAIASLLSLAVRGDGTVWAWGTNEFGQLGDGTRTDSSRAVQVRGAGGVGVFDGVVAVSTSGNGSLALKGDGSVWIWGAISEFPIEVLDETGLAPLTGVTAIASGNAHATVLRDDGTVWAWGWNMFGQCGDGTDINRTLPVQVLDPDNPANPLSDVVRITTGAVRGHAIRTDGTIASWGDNSAYSHSISQMGVGATIPDVIPPDQGNVLRAVRDGVDVRLSWTGTGSSAWRIYRDPQPPLGLTAVTDALTVETYVDPGRVPVATIDYYRVKGLSDCSSTPGL